jgi:hypothetical protein
MGNKNNNINFNNCNFNQVGFHIGDNHYLAIKEDVDNDVKPKGLFDAIFGIFAKSSKNTKDDIIDVEYIELD